jgi:addiction module RelE/StbE family toxin
LNIVWTATAARNRDAQLTYVGQDNPSAALRLDLEIVNQIRQLLLYPEIGRIGRLAGTRELVINRTPFIAIYRIRPDSIQILRLLHGAQLWP